MYRIAHVSTSSILGAPPVLLQCVAVCGSMLWRVAAGWNMDLDTPNILCEDDAFLCVFLSTLTNSWKEFLFRSNPLFVVPDRLRNEWSWRKSDLKRHACCSCVTVCCRVLQGVAAGCCRVLRVLQGVAGCCCALQCVAVCCDDLRRHACCFCIAIRCRVLQRLEITWNYLRIISSAEKSICFTCFTYLFESVALCCFVLCCVALQCVTLCCSALQCVAVCYIVLQCVAVCCSVFIWVNSVVGGSTWLIRMCNVTHAYRWHDSFICLTWLIHTCDMTHSYACNDSSICATWLDPKFDTTHWYLRRDFISSPKIVSVFKLWFVSFVIVSRSLGKCAGSQGFLGFRL